jgi:penicillin-binding protein 2D
MCIPHLTLLRSAAFAAALFLATAPLDAQEIACGPLPGNPQYEAWQIIGLPQSSLVFARDSSLIGEIGLDWRTTISIRTLPRYVGQAFIAVEDQRFYQHDGVDLVGVAGAIKGKLLGEQRGGASTITQQLVGNMHPDLIDRRDVSVGRKLREQAAAREMEKHYNKDQILEGYLNTINFGHRWCGIEAAARHYFGTTAAKLTLAQAATLAALPKSPAGYDPARHPDKAKVRRDLILGLMAEQKYITRELADQTRKEPVKTAPNNGMSVAAPYFVDAVRQIAERAGVPITAGGLRVYTTADPLLQRSAAEALVEGTAKVEARPGYKHPRFSPENPSRTDYLQGMVVAVDPASGDVRALVGGRDYAASPFDRAINALRQPGSSFKPFVYAKALEDSIPARTIVPDTALAIPLPNGDVYRPKDDDGEFLGPMSIRDALVHSRNSVAIQLGMRVGMDSVAALAARLGIDTPILPYPASAIGATEVRPLDFIGAWTAFATNGQVVTPRLLTRIEDHTGRVLYELPAVSPRQVLDPAVAFVLRDMMREVVERGTGTAARRAVPDSVPVAGKTGTTNDNTDLWFVGMTPDLVAGVWLGFDKRKSIAQGVAGGSLAAPIWGQMMGRYYENRAAGAFPIASDIIAAEVDRDTGELATSRTSESKRTLEFFVPGSEPAALRDNPWKIAQWGALIAR